MDTVRVYTCLALGNLTCLCGLGIHMLLFSLRCSWPEGSPSGGFDRGCLDSGFSELVSLEYDREASLASFLRSHPCIQVSHLYLVPLCQHYSFKCIKYEQSVPIQHPLICSFDPYILSRQRKP